MDDSLGLIMIGQFMIMIAQLENIVQALRSNEKKHFLNNNG